MINYCKGLRCEAEILLFLLPWLYMVANTSGIETIGNEVCILSLFLVIVAYLGFQLRKCRRKLDESDSELAKLRTQLKIEIKEKELRKEENDQCEQVWRNKGRFWSALGYIQAVYLAKANHSVALLCAELNTATMKTRKAFEMKEKIKRDALHLGYELRLLIVIAAIPYLCPEYFADVSWMQQYFGALLIVHALRKGSVCFAKGFLCRMTSNYRNNHKMMCNSNHARIEDSKKPVGQHPLSEHLMDDLNRSVDDMNELRKIALDPSLSLVDCFNEQDYTLLQKKHMRSELTT